MGMQVHFDLRDVLRYHAVTFISVELEGETTLTGVVNSDVGFNVATKHGLPDSSCWADVVHNRDIIHWLIDQRVPFNVS